MVTRGSTKQDIGWTKPNQRSNSKTTKPKLQKKKTVVRGTNTACLKDLRPEDKQKIGNLIRKVVQMEGEQRSMTDDVQRRHTDLLAQKHKMDKLKKQNQQIIKETVTVKSKYTDSVRMLRDYQTRLRMMYEEQQRLHRESRESRQLKHEIERLKDQLQSKDAILNQTRITNSIMRARPTLIPHTSRLTNCNNIPSQTNQSLRQSPYEDQTCTNDSPATKPAQEKKNWDAYLMTSVRNGAAGLEIKTTETSIQTAKDIGQRTHKQQLKLLRCKRKQQQLHNTQKSILKGTATTRRLSNDAESHQCVPKCKQPAHVAQYRLINGRAGKMVRIMKACEQKGIQSHTAVKLPTTTKLRFDNQNIKNLDTRMRRLIAIQSSLPLISLPPPDPIVGGSPESSQCFENKAIATAPEIHHPLHPYTQPRARHNVPSPPYDPNLGSTISVEKYNLPQRPTTVQPISPIAGQSRLDMDVFKDLLHSDSDAESSDSDMNLSVMLNQHDDNDDYLDIHSSRKGGKPKREVLKSRQNHRLEQYKDGRLAEVLCLLDI